MAALTLLVLKLVLTPLFIGGISLASRRFGQAVGGWLIGLPLTSGPVSVFLAQEQGLEFAQAAAPGMIAGVIAVAVFCVVYSRSATRFGSAACVGAAVMGFLVVAALLADAPKPPFATYGVTLLSLLGAYFLLPRMQLRAPAEAPPWWDIPLRMVVATVVVVVLTGIAAGLGPDWTGVLAPFPVFTSVLGVFAHRHGGPGAAVLMMRGLLLGLFSFASFFLTVGLLLVAYGPLVTFGLAAAIAVAVNGTTWAIARPARSVAPPAEM